MKILVVGGTRFVGKAIVSRLLEKGNSLTLFTRGNKSVPDHVRHIKGDRNEDDDLKQLQDTNYDVIIDSSGRTREQTERILEFSGPPNYRFVYISSAGIYSSSQSLPLSEDSPLDKNSRHIGKAETESFLEDRRIPFTSFRPTYIYGPGNYNPIETWFFDRITNNKIIPMPGDGQLITQLGHVSDLAEAIVLSLESNKSENSIYNCSGKKGITIKGLIESATLAAGKNISDIQLKSFDIEHLDKKARKLFPIRLTHFFTDISHLEQDLDWTPKFDLDTGLTDSFSNDYLLNAKADIDFSSDDSLFY